MARFTVTRYPLRVILMEPNLSKQEELRNRTKRFALRIIRLFRHLPRTTEVQVLGKTASAFRNIRRSKLSGGRSCKVESGIHLENGYCC